MNIVKWISVSIVFFVIGFCTNEITIGKYREKHIKSLNGNVKKHKVFYIELVSWVKLKQSQMQISSFLASKGYKTIAIYGIKELGELLLDELRNSDINVLYAIDRNAENVYPPIDVYFPNENLPKVDAIIITVPSAYNQIVDDLSNVVDCPMLSIDDVLKGCKLANDYNRYNYTQ